jgi:hypothetical protein
MAAVTGMGDELRTVTFENQVVAGGTVPDARVSGRFTWWFETKTRRGAYSAEGHDRTQLREHANLLAGDSDTVLFVLTPDPARPAWFDRFDSDVDREVASRVIWLSFRQFATTIEEISSDATRLLGEQTRFLLAELVQLFEDDGLLTDDDTVIVAAHRAWPFYQSAPAYVCQPNRAFKEGLTHLGFYADGAIQPLVARIRHHYAAVTFTLENVVKLRTEGEHGLADLIDTFITRGTYEEGESHDVFLLSPPSSEETVKLDQPVLNDSKTSSGQTWAWTLNQRYTSLDRLRGNPKFTSEL